MNNRGYSLATVLVLSMIIFVIGGAGLYIATTNLKTTAADVRFNFADKASNFGILTAVDDINRIGFCANTTNSGTVGNASYTTNIRRSGRICFVRSTGTMNNARVVKTSIIQSYYGLGLYTVRGNVNATLGGTGVRLSGCDRSITPTCFMPAFIASGNITTTIQQRACGNDTGSTGLYGNPAVLPNVIFDDLIPLFFNVNCFNKYAPTNSCTSPSDVSLLEIFRDEFTRINSLTNSREATFNNAQGIPVLDMTNIITQAQSRENNVSTSCRYGTQPAQTTLNLSNQLTNCSEIRIESATTTITGTRSGAPVTIYAFRGTGGLNFNNTGINPQWVTIYTNRQLTVSNASNFTLYTNNTSTLNNNIGESDSNNPATVSFRVLSTNTVTTGAGVVLRNGTIIIAPTDVNATNSNTAPQNLVASGNITLDDVALFTRRIAFSANSTANLWNSVIYVYAYACPNCSRTSSTSSLNACDSDQGWCGWTGSGITLNLGRNPSDVNIEQPTIFISNNTTVRTDSPAATYIWGAWVGEDVTYLRWTGTTTTQNFRGFLIRNFPTNLTLTINISSNFNMEFKKSLLDKLSQKYWWFRKVDCVLDDMSPLTQLIQTRMSAY